MSDSSLSSETVEEITNALAGGNKILAIKIYREATGQGLLEAKEFVEELIPQLLEKDPERFAKAASGSGCGAAIAFLLAGTGSLIALAAALLL